MLQCSMSLHDHTEVELTVKQVAVRDLETNEERQAWEVTHENMEGVIREDTAKKALEVFAACLESDNDDARINLEDLEAEPETLV